MIPFSHPDLSPEQAIAARIFCDKLEDDCGNDRDMIIALIVGMIHATVECMDHYAPSINAESIARDALERCGVR